MTDQTTYPERDMDGGTFNPVLPEPTAEEEAEYQAQYEAEHAAQEYALAYSAKYGLTDPALIDAIHDSHYAYLINESLRNASQTARDETLLTQGPPELTTRR